MPLEIIAVKVTEVQDIKTRMCAAIKVSSAKARVMLASKDDIMPKSAGEIVTAVALMYF